MKPKVQMVNLVCKGLSLSLWSLGASALMYNSGKGWVLTVDPEEVKAIEHELEDGYVCQLVEDFCLDYLAGRFSPNLFMNIIDNAYTKKKGRKR